jgi:uncharacterized protein YuzE
MNKYSVKYDSSSDILRIDYYIKKKEPRPFDTDEIENGIFVMYDILHKEIYRIEIWNASLRDFRSLNLFYLIEEEIAKKIYCFF